VRIAEQMKNIITGSSEVIIYTDDFIAPCKKPLAQVRPQKSSPTCHQNALTHARISHDFIVLQGSVWSTEGSGWGGRFRVGPRILQNTSSQSRDQPLRLRAYDFGDECNPSGDDRQHRNCAASHIQAVQ
jgi:hypothetical protein